MDQPFSSALYYPFIDIHDERWLRSAVLFWDNIQTIVPESIRSPYSSQLAQELHGEGILLPLRVASEMEEIEELTDDVLDYLTDPASASVLLAADTNQSRHLHPDKLPRSIREWIDIHPEKLPDMVRREFERFATPDGWYRVDANFANYYMTLLATSLSKRLGLGLVTPSRSADELAIAVKKGKPVGSTDLTRRHYWHGEYRGYGPRRDLPSSVARGMMVDIVLDGISLPDNITATELIRFKRDHNEELAVFRKEIAKLTSGLDVSVPVDALRQLVHDQFESNVRPAIKSLRSSLTAQNWDNVLNGFMKVSFLSAAPTSAMVYAGLPSYLALLAGAGISITATAVLIAEQRRRLREQSPYTYLLSLEREFK